MNQRELEVYIGSWRLIPSKGGKFEFTVNGEMLFSKKGAGRHAQAGEIQTALREKLTALLGHPPVAPPDED